MKTQVHDNLTRIEAQQRAAIIPAANYNIELDLTKGDEQFGSLTTITFKADGATSTFLDIAAEKIVRATLNGVELPLDDFNGVRLPVDGLKADNELVIDAICAFRQTGSGFTYFLDPVDSKPYLHTQSEPFDAHAVFACFDQPDIKGTFTIAVEVPETWKVASNMAPTSSPDGDAGGRWEFAPTPILSTYLACVVAGPFHIITDSHRGIDLSIWCRESLAKFVDHEEFFEVTKQGFDFFEKAFDYPYPFGKYDQLFVPEYKFGAMENPGCVTFTESYIFRSKVTDAHHESRAGTILHEMAHMWFGDLVTMRWWNDLWLNESFATYMGNLAVAEATRFKGVWAAFATSMKGWAMQQDQLPTTHPIVADIPDIDATHLNFDGITYAKGASVLKQFVAWAGYDAFIQGVRQYFKTHEWSNTELPDFLTPIAEASGRDLTAWAEEWLQTSGVNTFRLETETDGTNYQGVTVIQEGETLRSHRLAIGLYDRENGKLIRRKHVEIDVTGPRTSVPALEGVRVADLLLPNDDDLTYAKIRLDDRSQQTLIDALSELSDPVARALCWASTWDMTRDAEMSATDFLNLVTNNLASEADMSVVGALLSRSRTTITSYSHPSKIKECKARFAAAMHKLCLEAAAGSDHQLAFAAAWFANSGADDVAALKSLLDGSTTIEGLVIDNDRRWSIVGALAFNDAIDDAGIAAELERDPTDQGVRRAAAVRACRPTAEAKQAAWQDICEHESLLMLRTVGGAFGDPEHPDLMQPYVEPFFDLVVDMFNTRGPDYGLQFAGAAYPRFTCDPDVVTRTTKLLERDDVPQPIRRILLEGADSIERALRARSRDSG